MGNRQTNLVGGALLILIGLFVLAIQFVPGLGAFFHIRFTWPLIIVGVGLVLLVLGVVVGEPGMAMPACMVGGIGCVLYVQNLTGNWTSWAYSWALLPGFVGVGMVLSSLLGGKEKVADGVKMILVSMIMFAIFGTAFGAFGFLGQFWPVLLILLGLVVLAQGFFRNRE